MKYAKAIKQLKEKNKLSFYGLRSIGLAVSRHKTRRIKKLWKKVLDEEQKRFLKLNIERQQKHDNYKPKGNANKWYL